MQNFFANIEKSNWNKAIFLTIFCFFTFSMVLAQKEKRFVGAAFVGLNLSQMDGDRHRGYREPGFVGGLSSAIFFTKNFNVAVELAYSERGARSGEIDRSRISLGIHPFSLELSYAEVAILPNLYVYESYDDFYRLKLSAGLSYGRLINRKVEETFFSNSTTIDPIVYAEAQENLKTDDLNALVGITYFFKNNIGLELRHGISLRPIYQNEGRRFLPYYLSLRGVYYFL